MFINREGKILKENDVVECNKELVTKYVVRLIKDEGWRKSVIAEEEFNNWPSHNQIRWCLAKHKDACFAVVETIYRLDNELPF